MIAGKVVVVLATVTLERLCRSMRSYGARVIVTRSIHMRPAGSHGGIRSNYHGGGRKGNIFVTTTGNRDVVTIDHMLQMKDQAIVCNMAISTMRSR